MDSIIFHIDVNSAFLSWEAAYRIRELGETEDLRLIPCVVGGSEESRHGIVLAKSDRVVWNSEIVSPGNHLWMPDENVLDFGQFHLIFLSM